MNELYGAAMALDDALTHIAQVIRQAADELEAMNDLADAEEILHISAGDLRAIIMDAIDNLPRLDIEPFGYGEAPRSYRAIDGEFLDAADVDGLADVIMRQIAVETER